MCRPSWSERVNCKMYPRIFLLMHQRGQIFPSAFRLCAVLTAVQTDSSGLAFRVPLLCKRFQAGGTESSDSLDRAAARCRATTSTSARIPSSRRKSSRFLPVMELSFSTWPGRFGACSQPSTRRQDDRLFGPAPHSPLHAPCYYLACSSRTLRISAMRCSTSFSDCCKLRYSIQSS